MTIVSLKYRFMWKIKELEINSMDFILICTYHMPEQTLTGKLLKSRNPSNYSSSVIRLDLGTEWKNVKNQNVKLLKKITKRKKNISL